MTKDYVRVIGSDNDLGITIPEGSYVIELVTESYRRFFPTSRQSKVPRLESKEGANELAARWASKLGIEARFID